MQLVCVHRQRVRGVPCKAVPCVVSDDDALARHSQISSTPTSLFPTNLANQRCRRGATCRHLGWWKGDKVHWALWSTLDQPPSGATLTLERTCMDDGPVADARVCFGMGWGVVGVSLLPWTDAQAALGVEGAPWPLAPSGLPVSRSPCGARAQVCEVSFT